jgi:hypothetical protein
MVRQARFEETTTPDAVDVAAAMRQADTDVFAEAREQFNARLRAYRQGVAAMAANEGRLPPDQAEQLLTVCRDLGIPPARLDTDVVTMIRHSRLVDAINAVMEKADQQARVVAELQAEVDVETAAFRKVKVEHDQRLRAAEARLNEVQRRHAAAAAVRPPRVHDQQSDMLRLRNVSPHLWSDIDADTLRRLVAGR